MRFLSFVVDTNVLIEIEKNNKKILSKLEELGTAKGDICITSPTYAEFYFGLLKISGERFSQEKERLDKYKLLNTSKNSSKLLAEIKHNLSKTGVIIPIFDLFIASIAMDSRMPLVTLDFHFKRISHLNVILI